MTNILSGIDVLQADMMAWRRDIHAHPETAYEEVRTARLVADLLLSFGLEVHEGLAKTGVVGILKKGDGPAFGLRADMDALYIQEETNLPYMSVHDGKMHACGHDGHTAMLLGAAKYLAQNADFNGTLYFVFQPAEENEGGAKRMIEEGLFDHFPMEAIFGLHNYPGLPTGHFAIRSGGFLAACDSFHIRVIGQGCHAAMPDQGIDSILIGAEIVQAIQKIVAREIPPVEPVVISTTKFHGGEAINVCPDDVMIEGSCRYFLPEVGDKIEQRLGEIARSICAAHGAQADVTYKRLYPPLINWEEQTKLAIAAATSVSGAENVTTAVDRVMGSEDFAYYLRDKPGCYIVLGTGTGAPGEGPPCQLHNPHYDFNDDILTTGARYWIQLVRQLFHHT